MKVAVFGWDETLAMNGTKFLFPGAIPLLKELIRNGIELYIMSSRPSVDPSPIIFSALSSKGINIKQTNIIWATKQLYLEHDMTGQSKSLALKNLQEVNQYQMSDILFVDDGKQYIECAKSNSFKTLLVPDECFIGSVALRANKREVFYHKVKQMLLGDRVNTEIDKIAV